MTDHNPPNNPSDITQHSLSHAHPLHPHHTSRLKTINLLHGSIFGFRPLPPSTRTTAYTKPIQPFHHPKTQSYIVPIPNPDKSIPLLLQGSISRTMNEKLHIYSDGPDLNGTSHIHIYHSWTGQKLITLDLHVPLPFLDPTDTEAYVTAITYDEETTWPVIPAEEESLLRIHDGVVTSSTSTSTSATHELNYSKNHEEGDREQMKSLPRTLHTFNIDCPAQTSLKWTIRPLDFTVSPSAEEDRLATAKYVAIEACRYVLGVDLMGVGEQRTPVPSCWARLVPEWTYPEELDVVMHRGGGMGVVERDKLRSGDRVKLS